MKNTWLLVGLFILLGAGAFYAIKVKDQSASKVSWDMDFAIKNPDEVGKIFIADRNGKSATLERKDGYWLYNGKHKARPTAVGLLFETITQVVVNYIPPIASTDYMVKGIATEGITVEIWDRQGKRLKRYYVGGVTNDERGTFFMMEGAEQPYVCHIPTFVGQLRVRYLLGDEAWRDRTVFDEKPEEIQSISVEYPLQKFQSFKLEKVKEAVFEVYPAYKEMPVINRPQRKGYAEGYLLQFQKLTAEAFENEFEARDSVILQTPFAIVSVKKIDGTEKKVRFFPTDIQSFNGGAESVNRYFADCSWGDFMLTQQRVFGPIFRGYDFFFEPGPGMRN